MPPDRHALVDHIKRRALVAMFSDDVLVSKLVFKGGNALDLIHGVAPRGSIDLDFSIPDDFETADQLRTILRRPLELVFGEDGLVVFDLTVTPRPAEVTPDLADFWGGYLVQFKLIEKDRYQHLRDSIDDLRRQAIGVGKRGSTNFKIEISKYEYCDGKQRTVFDDYDIYVYTPQMIASEKVRAICQQMPEYGSVVKRSRPGAARARDFIDLYALATKCDLDFSSGTMHQLVATVFATKKVPLSLIGRIPDQRDFHEPDFHSVKDTMKPGMLVGDFDFYFDFVVDACDQLKPLWDE